MKEIIKTSDAPAPIGPYNQAVKSGNTLYISGQIAIDPKNGQLHISNIQEETRMVMKHLGCILNAAGMDYSNIVKCSIFIKDMKQFGAINEIYSDFFKENAPARETVEVSALPKNVNVEISAIAVE